MARKKATSSDDIVIEQRMVQFAEQLGRVIGTVQAKAGGWLDRETLNTQIAGVRDAAADLLKDVAGDVPSAAANRTATRDGGARASRGAVDAPGKRHRKPAPSARGAKHSDERIAKLKMANQIGRRRG